MIIRVAELRRRPSVEGPSLPAIQDLPTLDDLRLHGEGRRCGVRQGVGGGVGSTALRGRARDSAWVTVRSEVDARSSRTSATGEEMELGADDLETDVYDNGTRFDGAF
jgi:hypothetical protein